MKKIITILAVVGLMVFSSCEGPEGPPGMPGEDGQDGLIAEVFELRNVSFVNDPADSPDIGYYIYRTLDPKLYDGDVILIYRKSDQINASTPVWQSIPRTLYLNEGELDYDFDFSKEDFYIYVGGTYNLSLTPQYWQNQTFRIVIVPGNLTNKTTNKKVDMSNYDAVIKAYNIDDSKVKVLD